jgi:phage terminase large subunit
MRFSPILHIDIYKALFSRGEFGFIVCHDGKSHQRQNEAFKVLADNDTTEIVYGGGAGSGKTFLACTWLLFMSLNYPGTKYFIGREELKRLRDTTLLTFFKVCKQFGVNDFKYNGQDHFIEFANGSRIDLLDLKYLPSDPLFERYGSSEYTSGFIEEGGEVYFDAFDTLKSRIGRQLNDKYFITGKILTSCNPKKNWLYKYFYKPHIKKTLPFYRKFIQALVQDNPFIESGYIESLERIEDRTKKSRLLSGLWEYDSDPSLLIEFDALIDLFENSWIHGSDYYLTVDVARLGQDRTVICVWQGWRVVKIEYFQGKKLDYTKERCDDLEKRFEVPRSNQIVDQDGLGGGIVDFRKGMKGFVNGSKAIKNENYINLKSQCYYSLCERINKRQIWIDIDDPNLKEIITQELEILKMKDADTDYKMGIISKSKMKEILGRSPDFADALMMREYFVFKKGHVLAYG